LRLFWVAIKTMIVPRKNAGEVVPLEIVERCIYVIRKQRVMLASDLARMYGVETGALNRAIARNPGRFPPDFMFQLTREEVVSLRCQIGISNADRGGSRYLPYAFTEQGVAMLASVLHSDRAVQVNIAVVRAFVRLRELMVSNKQLAGKFAELEARVAGHDEAIQNLFEAIKAMLADPPGPKRVIGFNRQNEKP